MKFNEALTSKIVQKKKYPTRVKRLQAFRHSSRGSLMKSHDEVRDLRVLTHAEVAMSSSAAAASSPLFSGAQLPSLLKHLQPSLQLIQHHPHLNDSLKHN
jgi:hypothetical protein